MRRRHAIRAVGTGIAFAAAGCLGFGGGDGDSENGSDDSDTDTGGDGETDPENGEGTDTGGDGDTDPENGGGTDTGDDDGDTAIESVDGAWRTFQGDTASTGTGRGEATGPVSSPAVEWTVTAEDDMRGDPVIVDGTVLAGSWDERLYAVSLSSGEQLWTYDAGDAQSFPAAVTDGTVFVGGGKTVAALDLASGDPSWTARIDRRTRGGPVVADGTLYVPTQDALVALAAADGNERWAVRTGGPVDAVPHVTGDAVYFTSADGNVYAVGTDGEQQWQQFVSSSGGFPSPTVADGTLYVGWGDGTMYALDAADGTELWTDRAGGAETVAVADGTVFVAGYPLKAIAADTQDPRWEAEEPEGLFTDFTVGTDRVYLGTDEATVIAYDRETGGEQWRHQHSYAVETSVAVAEGMLVFGDEFGNLVALA